MAGIVMSVDGYGMAIAARLREIENAFATRVAFSKATGYRPSTLQSWIEGRTAPPFSAVADIARKTGRSLEWLAFGEEPKLREYDAPVPKDDRIGRHQAEAIYEAILRDISAFLGQRGWNMTLRRQHQLAEEFLNYVIRYDEADTRAAVLEVLIETRIPVVYEEQTAHEKIGPPSGRPGSEPPEEPSK